jgi:hypothetical protein
MPSITQTTSQTQSASQTQTPSQSQTQTTAPTGGNLVPVAAGTAPTGGNLVAAAAGSASALVFLLCLLSIIIGILLRNRLKHRVGGAYVVPAAVDTQKTVLDLQLSPVRVNVGHVECVASETIAKDIESPAKWVYVSPLNDCTGMPRLVLGAPDVYEGEAAVTALRKVSFPAPLPRI